jgi:hypothetical protein
VQKGSASYRKLQSPTGTILPWQPAANPLLERLPVRLKDYLSSRFGGGKAGIPKRLKEVS